MEQDMFWRTLVLGAAGMACVLGTTLMTSEPAEAKRKRCYFIARDSQGNIMADGAARGIKMKWACNKAERRCKWELERKRRHGKAGRGSCHRVENY
jgi:hypothetical protein